MARQQNVPQTGIPAATHKQRMCSRSFIAIDFLAYKNSLGYVTPSPGKSLVVLLNTYYSRWLLADREKQNPDQLVTCVLV